MPKSGEKTKTQAQKREERDAKIAAAAEERQKQAELYAQEAKKKAEMQHQASGATLSKKEKRLAKKAASAAEEPQSPLTGGTGGAESSALTENNNAPPSRARLVELNHSTYLEGLIPVLRRAVHQLPGNFTIVPGKLRNTGRTGQGTLSIKPQRELDEGTTTTSEQKESDDDQQEGENALAETKGATYKFLATLGGSYQEVYVRGPGSSLEKVDNAIQKAFDKCSQAEAQLVREEEGDAQLANMAEMNRMKKAERDAEWRDDHQETHLRNVQLNKEGQERVRLQERERTLKTKVSNESAAVYASRDHEIVEGSKRTKNSMK